MKPRDLVAYTLSLAIFLNVLEAFRPIDSVAWTVARVLPVALLSVAVGWYAVHWIKHRRTRDIATGEVLNGDSNQHKDVRKEERG